MLWLYLYIIIGLIVTIICAIYHPPEKDDYPMVTGYFIFWPFVILISSFYGIGFLIAKIANYFRRK